jgi:hypothetical protein
MQLEQRVCPHGRLKSSKVTWLVSFNSREQKEQASNISEYELFFGKRLEGKWPKNEEAEEGGGFASIFGLL